MLVAAGTDMVVIALGRLSSLTCRVLGRAGGRVRIYPAPGTRRRMARVRQPLPPMGFLCRLLLVTDKHTGKLWGERAGFWIMLLPDP
jgi:hypothetical protein